MAEPFLSMPNNWYHGTLEPDENREYITSVGSGGTPSTKDEDNWNGEIPWLTPKEITNLTNSIYVSQTERNITELGLNNSGARLMPSDTVMLTKRAPVGAVVINAVPMATNQGFLNFRCGPKLKPLYLAYWLRINKKYLDMVSNGSTYQELYKGDLFEFKIAIPPVKEQEIIIDIINSVRHIKLLGSIVESSSTVSNELKLIQGKIKNLNRIEEMLVMMLLSGLIDTIKLNKQSKSFL